MKIKVKFLLYILVLHIIFLCLSFLLYRIKPLYFLLAEVFILASFVISLLIYRQLIQPVDALASATESIKDKDFSMKMVKVGYYEMDRLIDVYNLMIDQLREERLSQQEKHFFLQKLINAAPSGIIILDLNEAVISINPAAEEFTGMKNDQVKGKQLNQLSTKLFREISELKPSEPRIVSLSGIQTYKLEKVPFFDRGFNHFFVIVEKLSDHIIRSERKAYEGVIRMMSHEINNSIGSVNSILRSSLEYMDKSSGERSGEFREGIETAIERNEHLNRFMNNFSDVVRIPEPNLRKTDLNELLEKIFNLIAVELEQNELKLVKFLWKDYFPVHLDAYQIEQVLVNIFKNSIEASEPGSNIEVVTELKPEPYLIIRDFGRGIPADIQERIFSPFFSTKKNGQGIGLTLTREILMNHGFRFSLRTGSDHSTEFKILFTEKS